MIEIDNILQELASLSSLIVSPHIFFEKVGVHHHFFKWNFVILNGNLES